LAYLKERISGFEGSVFIHLQETAMAQILCRLRFHMAIGGDGFFYSSDLEELRKFGLNHHLELKDATYIIVGSRVLLGERQFEVVRIDTHFLDHTNPNQAWSGINPEEGEPRHPFNFEVTYFVKKVD